MMRLELGSVVAAAVGGPGCFVVVDYDVDPSVEHVAVGVDVHKIG